MAPEDKAKQKMIEGIFGGGKKGPSKKPVGPIGPKTSQQTPQKKV